MKDFKRSQIVILLFNLLTIAFIFISFKFYFPVFVDYISFFLFGIAIAFAILQIFQYRSVKRLSFLENRMKLWNTISYRVKNAGEKSFNDMPLGIVVFDREYNVLWANNYSKDIFLSPLVDRNFKNIDRNLAEKISSQATDFNITLYGQIYHCEHLVENNIIYLTNITDRVKVMEKYENKIMALGVLNLDNLSIAFSSLDAQEKSLQISNLIGILSEWAEKYNISITGYSEERYLLILDRATLNELINENFSILDKVKDYTSKENLRLTASIGLCCLDTTPIALMDEANSLLELALNRGGNQAVVKINNETIYFGAKTESYEARNAVNVRIKTEELRDLILEHDKVIVMSHIGMDADAFASAIAVKKIADNLGKDAKVVFSEKLVDETVVNIYNTIKKEHINHLDNFIDPKKAIQIMDLDTLLIIVDVQYQNLLMEEKIYKKAKKLAIIDHHRRNNQAINNFDYIYTQTTASSSVELVVEMFDYFEEIELSSIEATWMLMGVLIDTNNFVYRTTSRTFNVLAKLQTYGANMSKVQKYLREGFQDYVKKISILNNIEIVDGIYGIVLCDDDIYQRAFLAKIANEVVLVNNIKSAYCIGRISENTIGISARSLDEDNVQVIMEKMGGGGHFNNAATQIQGEDLKVVKDKLIKVLKENENSGDKSMKIILTKEVKGKGKLNDIIDIPNGHANFLIRSGQAIEATPDNIKHLENQILLQKAEAEKHLKEMKELAKKLESSPITIYMKIGKNGKLFGTVSTKQIADELLSQHKLTIDKRKILSDKDIDTLGTYKIPIQLHKEVTSTITLYVVEKE